MRRRLWLWILAALWLTGPSAAEAAARCVAVVVGNNYGGASKVRLRYAERDARRVGALLEELGGVGRVSLLLGRRADELRALLTRLERSSRAGQEVVLFFFYSGHADQHALLMGSSRFPFDELRRSLKRFPARTAISFVDACQSGQMTRAKGGRVVPIVDVRFDDHRYRGRVFITSSSAGESAQESDELGASFFTHYLLSGLRGAADDSGDGLVSLQEAYRFTYRHTLARTASTLQGPQHPSYHMELSGAGQLVLTHTRKASAHLVLPARARGTYYVRKPGQGMIAEVTKPAGKRMRLALAPGRYEVRKAAGSHHLVKELRVAASRDTELVEAGMVRRPLLAAAAKGPDPGDDSGIFKLTYSMTSGYLQQADLLHGLGVGYAHAVGPIHLGSSLGYATSGYDRDDGLDVRLHELTLLATAEWRWTRWSWFHPAVGVDVGGSWVWQSAVRGGGDPIERTAPVFRYRARLGAELAVVGSVLVGVWGHVGQVVLEAPHGVEAELAAGLEAGLLLRL